MNLPAEVIALAVGVAIAWATAFFTSRYYGNQAKADLEKEFKSRLNERKWETYTGFADTVRKLFQSSQGNRLDRDMPKLLGDMYQFIGRLWLVGSDEVVRSFVRWQRFNWESETRADAPVGGLWKLAEVLIEMRRDLGYDASAIEPEDLLGTFVKDIHRYAAPSDVDESKWVSGVAANPAK
jgi:hypothetical protein